jgi:hypothetical protein
MSGRHDGDIAARSEHRDKHRNLAAAAAPIDHQPGQETQMTADTQQNERQAMAQTVTNQPDGPGKRIGKRGEIILFGKVCPGGGKLFRERLVQFQAEAAYWESRVGTVHDFRTVLFDNDTRILFLITFDGDFKSYVTDIITQAGPWFDAFFPGIWEGYEGSKDRRTIDLVLAGTISADIFYVAHPDVSVRDVAKMKRLSKAAGELLDAAS